MSFINNMQLLINNKEHRERLFCNNVWKLRCLGFFAQFQAPISGAL